MPFTKAPLSLLLTRRIQRLNKAIKQRTHYERKQVELPILHRPLLHIAPQLLLEHLRLIQLPRDAHTPGRQLNLTLSHLVAQLLDLALVRGDVAAPPLPRRPQLLDVLRSPLEHGRLARLAAPRVLQRRHQRLQPVEAILDVAAPLLLGRRDALVARDRRVVQRWVIAI